MAHLPKIKKKFWEGHSTQPRPLSVGGNIPMVFVPVC